VFATLQLIQHFRWLQREIEVNLCEQALDFVRYSSGLFIDEIDLRHELITGGGGEIVIEVPIACQVDLGSEMTMTGRGDEEVNMRWTLAVAPQLIEQLLGRTIC
jgi:hypothetical protein